MEFWTKIWSTKAADEIPWQVNGPHKSLVKNISTLTDGKPHRHVLVPLCGASDDLVWLADQGHTVVGVEAVKKGIKYFFERNNLEYEVSAINIAPSGAYIYKAKGKNITIVEMDFWNFTTSIVGRPFDCVWDRGALVAVMNENFGGKGTETGKKYLNLLKHLVTPEGRVLNEGFVFDPADLKLIQGPIKPCLLDSERLLEICGDDWEREVVDVITLAPGEKFMRNSYPFKNEMVYSLLTLKQVQ